MTDLGVEGGADSRTTKLATSESKVEKGANRVVMESNFVKYWMFEFSSTNKVKCSNLAQAQTKTTKQCLNSSSSKSPKT